MDRPLPRVLVVVAGRQGATREIADALARDMGAAGIDARVEDAGDAPGPEAYDAVVIASAVDYGRWPAAARRYAARHAAVLTSLPVWLLSAEPLGAERDEEPPGVAAVRLMTGAREHLVVGGRLESDPLGATGRLVARVAGGAGADGPGGAPVSILAAGIAGALTGAVAR